MEKLSATRCRRLLALLVVVPVLMTAAVVPVFHPTTWTAEEIEVLRSLDLDQLPAPAADPSNRFDDDPRAVALGKRLFNDPRLSRNGLISCANCHNPAKGFQDGRPVAQGIGTGRRRSMPIVDAAYSPWMFWDGRKDSLWSQALGPLEDGNEHGGNRTQYVRQLSAHYRNEYAAVFGSVPDVAALPTAASPVGTLQERSAWVALDQASRARINRAFANMGKAVAAYERTLRHTPTRFDRYIEAVNRQDARSGALLSAQEVAGLRVFIGRGQCVSCHSGPLLTDQSFHNTGVPGRAGLARDHGRSSALAQVVADEFNCLGPYSDAKPEQCGELRYLSKDDLSLDGAFKTPGLRGIADRAPYMHAGQFATLEEVIAHYQRAPAAPIGRTELSNRAGREGRAPIRLSEVDVRNLTAFLRALSESTDALRLLP